MRKSAVGLALAAAIAAPRADAQRIRGTLTDSVTRERIPNGVVVLYDSAGRGLSRTISGVDGVYSVGTGPATRTLRVMRIGFRPRDIAVHAADSVVDVTLQPIPPMMSAVQSTDTRICAPNRGTSGIDLWEQARAGLLASLISRESSPPRMRVRTYRRVLDPVLKRTIADTIDYRDLIEARSFVAARPPWVFASYGYIRENGEGREYYAPDEGVLLDPTFAETHCLHTIDGRGPREGEVGIAFDPILDPARDTIVDITGALWLDRATYAPRTIEFHYTNLERDSRDAGGEVQFVLMPNGVSMVERWQIRAATLAYDEAAPDGLARRDIRRRDRIGGRVLAYQHMGGEVAFATWPDGKRWSSALPHIEGDVVDFTGAPVPGAVVWLGNRRDTVRTDSSGHFHFPPTEPGLYQVYASDSVLAVEGVYRSLPARAVVLASEGPKLTMRFYPRSDIFPSICPSKTYRPGTGVLIAHAVDSRGTAVPMARVEIESLAPGDTTSAAKPVQRRTGVTGDDGRFVVCGAERNQPLVVKVFSGDFGAGMMIHRWGDEFLSLKLELRPLKP